LRTPINPVSQRERGIAQGPAVRSSALLSDFLHQRFEPERSEPDNRQLYRILQQGILEGHLPSGTRLPPTRTLASELAIARNTVIHVYERLGLEGYVTSTVGRGTFVADTTPDRLVAIAVPRQSHAGPGTRPMALSARGQLLVRHAGAARRQWGAFVPGVPDVTLFPAQVWARLQSRAWRRPPPEHLSYAVGAGYYPLREALLDYLQAARGVHGDTRQVVITSGSHQALQLIAHLLADVGDVAWLEEPGYWGARNLMEAAGLQVVPVQVDAEGMNPPPELLRSPPRFIFVSPSHQYPLGSVMSLARRRKLLEYARSTGAWIIEDDYDSEFRHGSRPLPSLQSLDESGRVLYLGTFSKILFPGMRLGYLVVPESVADVFATGLAELYREGRLMTQAVLSDFIRDGHFVSHIRRMRSVYRDRHEALQEAIRVRLGSDVEVCGSGTGLHLVLTLPQDVDDVALCEDAMRNGIITRALSQYYIERSASRAGLLIGYACVPDADIPVQFARLSAVIRRHLRGASPR